MSVFFCPTKPAKKVTEELLPESNFTVTGV
jgi:hypothetical protein